MTSNAAADSETPPATPVDDRPSIRIVPFKHDHGETAASAGELALRTSSMTDSTEPEELDPEELERRDLLAEIRGERAQLVATARDLKGPVRQIRRATHVAGFAAKTARVIAVAAGIAGLITWMRGGKRPSTLLLLSLPVELGLALRSPKPARRQVQQAPRQAITP